MDHLSVGTNAHLAIFYYYFPAYNCPTASCVLDAGYVSSINGGATWSAPTALDLGMSLSWLAQAGGFMLGDYTSVSYSGGHAFPIFAAATAGTGPQGLHENMYTETGLSVAGGDRPASTAGAPLPLGSQPRRPVPLTAY